MYCDFNDNNIPCNNFTTEVDVRFTEKNRSQRHGIYVGDTYLGMRKFHAEGDILADNSAQYWDRRLQLISAIIPRPQYNQKIIGTLDLLLTGFDEHVSAECTIDGWPEIPLEALSPSAGRYQINWKAFDPRLYGNLQSIDIAYSPTAENIFGRSYNKTYNKSWSTAPVPPPNALIVNSGNIEVYPILTFYGPATNPVAIMNRGDGNVFVFRLSGVTLTDVTDTVTVDMEKHTVTRGNGVNLYSAAVGSDWFSFEPAPMTNLIRLSADSLALPAHLSIQWRNAYMI